VFSVSYGEGQEVSFPKKKRQETSFLSQSIGIYQNFLSRSDDDRCPMYPSCSTYAKQAFHTHGLIKGWILTSDRLLRCGHDEIELSGRKIIKGKYKTPDPLDKNDFLFR
jgi:putative component of membrane protein insertase Oxa1/YidC/SpoIIIJ protein YidD